MRTTSHLRAGGLLASLLIVAASAVAQPAGVPVPGPSLGSSAKAAGETAAKRPGFRDIKWDELMPADWDPMKDLKQINLDALQDGDPRAAAMLKKLRDAWDRAPANAAVDGAVVRIPGFVVPLEEGAGGLREFLLVPYFGACIHTPPPPSNQIIHVVPKHGVPFRAMDTVWVSGRLKTLRSDTYMGASGYRLDALHVDPYVEKAR